MSPTLPELFSKALSLQHADQPGPAATLYRHILVQSPAHADALHHLAIAESAQDNLGRALCLLDRAVRLEPAATAGQNLAILLRRLKNLAITHYNANRLPEALQAIRIVLRHGGGDLYTRAAYARMLGEVGDLTSGAAEYDWLFETLKTIDPATEPAFATIRGETLLLGWSYHRLLGNADAVARYAQKDLPYRVSTKPVWDGIPQPGARILFALDMGFGDAFQFVRSAQALRAVGMVPIIACDRRLARLLRSCPFVGEIVSGGEPMPEHDCWILSSRHGELLDALDDGGLVFPYLRAEPAARETWAARLRSSRPLKIALNLGASSAWRDLPLSVLEELARIDGVEIIDITKSGSTLPALREGPLPRNATHVGSTIDTGPDAFIEIAAILDAVDLVITTDTSIAHLAGAMARPVWVFLRKSTDCRWGPSDGPTPLYPTMRLFRQAVPGSWDDVLYRMKAALVRLGEDALHSPLPPVVFR